MMYTSDGQVTVIMPNHDSVITTSTEVVEKWLGILNAIIVSEEEQSLKSAIDIVEKMYILYK